MLTAPFLELIEESDRSSYELSEDSSAHSALTCSGSPWAPYNCKGGYTSSYVFNHRYAGESERRYLLHLDLREGLTVFDSLLKREGETRVCTFTKSDPESPGDSFSSEQGYEEWTQEIHIARPGQALTIHRETYRSDYCPGCRQETALLPVPGPGPGLGPDIRAVFARAENPGLERRPRDLG